MTVWLQEFVFAMPVSLILACLISGLDWRCFAGSDQFTQILTCVGHADVLQICRTICILPKTNIVWLRAHESAMLNLKDKKRLHQRRPWTSYHKQWSVYLLLSTGIRLETNQPQQCRPVDQDSSCCTPWVSCHSTKTPPLETASLQSMCRLG